MAISNGQTNPTASEGSDESDELNEHVFEPGDPDGVIAAEQRQRWQEKRSRPSSTPRAEYRRKRRWPILIVMILVIAVASYGAYVLGKHAATTKHTTTAAGRQTTASHTNVAAPTKNYSSNNYSLSFDYPEDWVVSDTSAKLTAASPALEMESAVGAKIQAHIVVTIESQQTSIPGFPSGGAVAALSSNDVSYKQPSSVQRAQTYVSYLSYTQSNGLDAIYVTGNNGYQQGQQIPMSDIVKGTPLISVGFENCQSVDCSTGPQTLSQ